MTIFVFVLLILIVILSIVAIKANNKVSEVESQFILFVESTNELTQKMFNHVEDFQTTTTASFTSLIKNDKCFLIYLQNVENRLQAIEKLLNINLDDDENLTSLKDLL